MVRDAQGALLTMRNIRSNSCRPAAPAAATPRRLLRSGSALHPARLDVAVVHLAGFVWKALADIVGVLHDMIAQFAELGAQFALLRHQQRRRSGCRDIGGNGGRRDCAFAPLLAHDLRGHDGPFDLGGAADGTIHKLALFLGFIGGRALKPAFERVAAFAVQGISDHTEPRTRCRCSGPALGSAMLKRRPCCSDGTVLRAVSTFEGSILARKTPGSPPPSASTSPQGATISEWP